MRLYHGFHLQVSSGHQSSTDLTPLMPFPSFYAVATLSRVKGEVFSLFAFVKKNYFFLFLNYFYVLMLKIIFLK
jgi:hypothetical protein